jgi:hypothetical protein
MDQPTPDQGFFIAQKLLDGSPGRPIGNEDSAIMLFEDLCVAQKVRDELSSEHGPLSIFKVNMVFCGEVVL